MQKDVKTLVKQLNAMFSHLSAALKSQPSSISLNKVLNSSYLLKTSELTQKFGRAGIILRNFKKMVSQKETEISRKL